MNKSRVFLMLRIIAMLVLACVVFGALTGAGGFVEVFTGLSEALAGDASLVGGMCLVAVIVGLVAMTLLIMKKTKAISVGAFLAAAMILAALVASVAIPGIDQGGGPARLSVLSVGLIASFAVLFRFRGSLPLLGKFT